MSTSTEGEAAGCSAGGLREQLDAVTAQRDEAEAELRTVQRERAALARHYAHADAAVRELRREVAVQAEVIVMLQLETDVLLAYVDASGRGEGAGR